MPNTLPERRTATNGDAPEQTCFAGPGSPAPGSRTRQAGSEFLKALADDLAALASWLRLWLIAKFVLLQAAARALAARASCIGPWLTAKRRVIRGAADDLRARASWIGPWLTAKRQRLKSTAGQVAARTPGGRTLQAGGSFLRAAAGDLAALAARLRLSAMTRYRRTPPLASAPDRVSRHRNTGRTLRRLGLALSGLAMVCALVLSAALLWAFRDFPVEARRSEADTPGLLLEAANGEPLGRIGPIKVADAARRDFPAPLVQAVLSMEDRHFYEHFGVDPQGIFRALRRNAAAGEVVQGGSTITQQLAKMRFVGNERTFGRKLREALTAAWLELRLGKDEILTRYLNGVYLGAGAYGMPAAARLYFDKSVKDLTLPEAAMLAGLIRAPSLYNPLRDPEKARTRAAIVLDAMVENGAIDAQAAADAKAKPADVRMTRDGSRAGSWFGDWVRKELADVTGSLSRSIRVRTTLVPGLQKLAEDTVQEVLAREGERSGATQAALVAMRPDGTVLAMVGGRDYRDSQFNRAVEANRQPGSTFKLFVYLAALRKGFSPFDTIDAGPVDIDGWQPENFDDRPYGRMTLADAFAHSVNTAAVRLAMTVGLDEVIAAARDLGIEAPLPKVPSLALGTAEVSLVEMTGAFASVRAGTRIKPSGVAAIGADDQSPLRAWGPAIGPAIGATQPLGAYREPMIEMLRQVVERGTGRAARLGGFAAGKTGTSQNHRDAWFIGFTESLVVGVWVGNDDGTPMQRVVGGTLPATIWHDFVSRASSMIATGLVGNERVAVARAPGDAVPPAAPPAAASAAPVVALSTATPAPQCDYRACAGAYRSFRASDCSYQSHGGGPRRFCDLGTGSTEPPAQSLPPGNDPRGNDPRGNDPRGNDPSIDEVNARLAGRSAEMPTPRGPQCNVAICARFYRSFDPSDCSYQPYFGGPRRICER
jgi:penicillin-binding protein 1A